MPKTGKGVVAMLQSWGYESPEEASKCAIAGIARGTLKVKTFDMMARPLNPRLLSSQVDFDAKLDSVAWQGKCYYCKYEVETTLRAVLDQPDSGNDYEDGSLGGGVVCTNDTCGARSYLSCMCRKEPKATCGKHHNHCSECRGFGMCLMDVREAHCNVCGKHYYQSLGCHTCQDREEEYHFLQRGGAEDEEQQCSIM